MPTICRMYQLTPEDVADLVAHPNSLTARVSAHSHGDVYRYWHAIEYLLAAHRPGTVAGRWLSLGKQLSPRLADVPGARVLTPAEVRELDAVTSEVPPDALAGAYDAAAMDAANVYPATWLEWEEDFDPLGQVLEHYSFLQGMVARCAKSGNGLLLYFDTIAEGEV